MSRRIIAVIAVALAVPFSVHAGEKEDELIAKITQAYGGEALLNLKNYKIEDSFLNPTIGQSHDPSLTEISTSKQVLIVDVNSNSAVVDSWSEGRGGGFQGATVSDGEKAYNINYPAGTYGEAGNADPHIFVGGTMRSTDTVLVYELNKVKDKAVLGEDTNYQNRLHHTISMPFPQSPDLKLFVDSETFLVSKMVRVNPQLGDLSYVFTNYKKDKGISYASSLGFFIAGAPNIISAKHELSFNVELQDDAFKLPEGLNKEGERIDTSEMVVNKISDKVYHLGQNGGFSIFADTSLGTVSAGGYPAINARFERFQKESKNYKPLAYQVVTHHHSDHIGGLAEAVALGAKLVTVEDNISAIQSGVSPSPKNSDFFKLKSRVNFGEGRNRVDVYEVSTAHAASFLVTYVPAEKLVFIADHMGSPYATGTPTANINTVTMLAALDALDIQIDKIATAHNARIFSIKDMRNSVAAYKPTECSAARPVCL